MTAFKNRKEQIERSVLPQLVRDLRKVDVGAVLPAQRPALKAALRRAAWLGAAAERARTLAILRSFQTLQFVESTVTKASIDEVIGYDPV
jgi:hypothetical protein